MEQFAGVAGGLSGERYGFDLQNGCQTIAVVDRFNREHQAELDEEDLTGVTPVHPH